MKKTILFTLIFIFAFSLTVCAANKISPAIDVIANDYSMVKASVHNNGELIFDISDFDDALGVNVNSIIVTSLPDEEVGRLMLDNLYIVENQVVLREDFSMLRFVSTSQDSAEGVFKFKPNNNEYELECSVKLLESVNLSPVASNGAAISAWTNMNISCFGALNGYDPNGDTLRYEVVSYPEKGLLMLTNTETGDYKYTPYEDARGTDAFSYRVRDSYGNYSEICTVKMKIEKLKTSLVFADFEDERCLNAAITVCENDLMNYSISTGGDYNFRPNDEVTREEFIVLVMKAMGAKEAPEIEKTRFADDSEITTEYKGYLESAFSLGIIKGTNESDGVHINPKKSITTAEAAKIIHKIIGAKIQTSMTVFADSDQIPEDAMEALTSLTDIGILEKTNGKISPNAPLTRAQTAQILMSLLEYRGKLKK
ncbi:MAG: hypothetical protein E7596_04590 [Ruminococcaceae bacterium]|nr:hypothetical protein [Oscillospiraceae bacterium]